MHLRFRQSILQISDRIRSYFEGDRSNIDDLLVIQLTLVKYIKYYEKRISEIKAEEGQQKLKLKIGMVSKENAAIIKIRIKNFRYKKDHYKNSIYILRSLGDYIAFSLFDPWDLKPLTFSDSSGNISGKSGLRNEIKILKAIFSNGSECILNNITNTIRHGDITVNIEGFPLIMEIKSSSSEGKRASRQIENINNIMEYLYSGETTNIYGLEDRDEQKMIRVSAYKEPEYYISELQDAVTRAYEFGTGLVFVGNEAAIVASTDSKISLPANILDKWKSEEIRTQIINSYKFKIRSLTPFWMSFSSDSHVCDIYSGDLVVAIFLNISHLKRIAYTNDYNLDTLEDDEWAFSLAQVGEPENKMFISHIHMSRIFFEFLRPEWLIENSINTYETSNPLGNT
ncbi:hypothetical protein BOO71_0001627 [Deinococcus marmoris]|uniref:Uncharacterized protein n=1 Tax=Deinococcus marmoris TaxID=249408 RepID=A0A1U7P3L9_9DEIO|nr:hypothetical protein BOO71_0001627 [Deinococcus marmoris]